MQYTKVDATLQKRIEQEIYLGYPMVRQIVDACAAQGWMPLLVGGAVRDLLVGRALKDLDIEIYGCTLDELEKLLARFGPVSLVGKVFGVLRVAHLDVDWSVPRSDSAGRKPAVAVDPHLPFTKAFARRDLTINAIGINLATMELIDLFGGVDDLKNKKARAADPQLFGEDPLRFFRVMQFIGRFELEPDDELNELCIQMDISSVSRERIEAEFAKLLLKSAQPSRGIRWLERIGRLDEVLPELAATRGIKQEPDWHPEGDVFEHTMQVIDAAAQLTYRSDEEKLAIMYAALCHDLGKVGTTRIVDGRIKSHGHEVESERLAGSLLKRITRNHDLTETVKKLVREHMIPGQLVKQKSSPAAYKKLARRLAPHTTIEMLALLALADKRGRNPARGVPLDTPILEVDAFLQKARELAVADKEEAPLIQGRDLLDQIPAGPLVGKAVAYAYDLQIDEGIKDKQELKRRAIEYISQYLRKV